MVYVSEKYDDDSNGVNMPSDAENVAPEGVRIEAHVMYPRSWEGSENSSCTKGTTAGSKTISEEEMILKIGPNG